VPGDPTIRPTGHPVATDGQPCRTGAGDLRDPRYPRRMGESTGAPLTPEQRERMQRAILAELRRIRDEAIAAGVPPATIARVVEERRRALDPSDDTEEASPEAQ
jgi:hypothetical protein